MIFLSIFSGVLFLVFLFISYQLYITKKFQDEKIKNIQMNIIQNNSKMNFNSDMEFLFYLINFKIKNIQNELIEPKKSSNSNMPANEELFLNCINTAITDVFFSLSEDYKLILYKYFTKESLIVFITQNIVNEFLKISLTMNLKLNKNILEENVKSTKKEN